MEKQEKAYKGVIEYFKNRIMAGELRPGEKLPPEREIAQMLEVSRNSVREALRIMDMTGVISSQQGSGNYITCEFQKSIAETMGMMFAMSQINYQQISQIRYALEQQAFALAIEQASESQMEALEELVRQNSSLGLDVRMVYGQDIRELIPDVSPEVQYATYCPTDGHANPMRTTLALYKRARELGAQFITNIKVLKLEKVAGRIRRVHTDDGIYEADSVILCAGFGSRKIMRTVGLDVPMLPQLTEAFVTEPIPAVTDKFISAADGCFYAQQQRNGTWVIGGDSNYEIYDATYPREVTFSFSAPRIARFFLEYMPTLKGVK